MYIPKHEAPRTEIPGDRYFDDLKTKLKKTAAVMSAAVALGGAVFFVGEISEDEPESLADVATSVIERYYENVSSEEAETKRVADDTEPSDQGQLTFADTLTPVDSKTPEQIRLENFISSYKDAAIVAQNTFQVPYEAVLAEAIVASNYGEIETIKTANSVFIEPVPADWQGPKHKIYINELASKENIDIKLANGEQFRFVGDQEGDFISVKAYENGQPKETSMSGEIFKLMKIGGVKLEIISHREDGLVLIEKPIYIRKFNSPGESILRLAEIMRSYYVSDALLDSNPGWFIGKHAFVAGQPENYANHRLNIINEIRKTEGQPETGFAPPPETKEITPEYYLQDSSQIPCPVGVDRGARVGYFNGVTHNIRVCNIVDGITVNTLLAGNVYNMLQAAEAEGVNIKLGWGYASYEFQAEKRERNGCNDGDGCETPTALPENSEHVNAGAIDFRNVDGTLLDYGDPGHNWLKLHAHEYGFYQLPSESWHWSWNGE